MNFNRYTMVHRCSTPENELAKGLQQIEELQAACVTVARSEMSILVKSKIINQLHDEIEEVKARMKKAIDKI